eukprot:766677-Amphidinium_carterae.1
MKIQLPPLCPKHRRSSTPVRILAFLPLPNSMAMLPSLAIHAAKALLTPGYAAYSLPTAAW